MARQRPTKVSIGKQVIGYVATETADYVEIAPMGGGPTRRLMKADRPRRSRKRPWYWWLMW